MFDLIKYEDSLSPLMDMLLEKGLCGSNNQSQPIDIKFNIYEEPGGYKILVLLPGVSKEDIILDIKDNKTIAVEVRKNVADKIPRFKEFTLRPCKRSIYLGNDIDEKTVEANLVNGILEILIKNKTNKEDHKRVEIK
jgi:HSP20 family protein